MCLFPLIRWVRWPISSSTAFFRLCSAWAGKRCASCWGGLVPPCGLVVQWTTPTTDSQRPFPTLCPSCVRYLTSTPTPSTSRSSCPTCPSPTAAPPSPRTWRPIVKHWSGKAFTSSRSVSAEMGHLKIDAIYLLFRESRELALLTKTFNKACTLIRLPLFSVRFVYFRNICGFIFRLYQLPPGGQLRNLMQS